MAARVRIDQKTAPAPAPAPASAPPPAAATTPTTARTGFDAADQFQPVVSAPTALTTPSPTQVDTLTGAMTSEQSQAFAQLSPADQQTLRDFTQTWALQLSGFRSRGFVDDVSEGLGTMRDAILSGQGATIANLARGVIASDQASGVKNGQMSLVNVLKNGSRVLTKVDPHTGKNLLQELSAMNGGGKTALGYDRSALAANILTDLSWAGMSQAAGAQDCGALAIAASMRQNPAAYAGMMIDLANGDPVTLPSGQSTQMAKAPYDPQSSKSMTNQLIDAAMSIPLQSDMSTGVTGEQVKDALQRVYGGSWAAMYTPDATEEPDRRRRAETQQMAVTIMNEQLQKDQPVFANYDGHWVRVTYSGPLNDPKNLAVEATAQDGKGVAQIPLQDFLDGLDGLVFQSNLTMPPEWMQNVAWADPGGGSPHGTQGSDDLK